MNNLKVFIANLGVNHIKEDSIKRKVSVFNQLIFAVIIAEVFLVLLWSVIGGVKESLAVFIQLIINIFFSFFDK